MNFDEILMLWESCSSGEGTMTREEFEKQIVRFYYKAKEER